MARLVLTNEEKATTLTVGITGVNANAGGKTGNYALEPGATMPIDVDSDTTLTIQVLALATIKTPTE